GASHDSHERCDPPQCYSETGAAVVNFILLWVQDRQRASSIMWLHGPLGAGKSTIAQRVAEECEYTRMLCSTFFFSRKTPRRDSSKYLIATITYQMIHSIPELERPVIDAIARDPALLSSTLQSQIHRLIVDPILVLMSKDEWPKYSPQLIIIDGLDECEDAEIQLLILEVISDMLITFPVPLCFLVASRIEKAIKREFNTDRMQKISSQLCLHGSFRSQKSLISSCRSKISEIRLTQPDPFSR
ncbi:hypothetical protein BDQ12DRAFT_616246, partial [Crucibulum laeve]